MPAVAVKQELLPTMTRVTHSWNKRYLIHSEARSTPTMASQSICMWVMRPLQLTSKSQQVASTIATTEWLVLSSRQELTAQAKASPTGSPTPQPLNWQVSMAAPTTSGLMLHPIWLQTITLVSLVGRSPGSAPLTSRPQSSSQSAQLSLRIRPTRPSTSIGHPPKTTDFRTATLSTSTECKNWPTVQFSGTTWREEPLPAHQVQLNWPAVLQLPLLSHSLLCSDLLDRNLTTKKATTTKTTYKATTLLTFIPDFVTKKF